MLGSIPDIYIYSHMTLSDKNGLITYQILTVNSKVWSFIIELFLWIYNNYLKFSTYVESHGEFIDTHRIVIACTEMKIQFTNQAPIFSSYRPLFVGLGHMHISIAGWKEIILHIRDIVDVKGLLMVVT